MRGAQYFVVGGFAIIHAGYDRHTCDIDLLVDVSLENVARVIQALKTLPDRAIEGLEPGELASAEVIRVADEFVVDLMGKGCGVTYQDAIHDAEWREIDGVSIPFASKATLWRMKQTVREKDIPDRLFLKRAMEAEGTGPAQETVPEGDSLANVPGWLKRLLARMFRQ